MKLSTGSVPMPKRWGLGTNGFEGLKLTGKRCQAVSCPVAKRGVRHRKRGEA